MRKAKGSDEGLKHRARGRASAPTALAAALLAWLGGCAHAPRAAQPALPTAATVDALVQRMMRDTGARGLALAVIDNGQVSYTRSYGARNAAGAPLQADSILYAASLTKTTFAYLVLQLVDAGRIDLDRPIATYLPKPLPEYTGAAIEDAYARWSDLAGDDRWKQLTPRMLLNHASGFANFGFLEPDGKLRFHFNPGSRYGYSGDGIMLLQFTIEQGLKIDVGQALQQQLFAPLGLTDTSLVWRKDFAGRAADGWTIDGKVEPHDDRGRVRAAGSMDTTIGDMAKLAAGLVRGETLSAKARRELVRPTLPITTASQFPSLQAELPVAARRKDLAAAVGVVVFNGPQGRGFFKGGHNDSTGNMLVCLEASRRCVVILGNDLRAEKAIPHLVDRILGATGMPWQWEYGAVPFWSPR
jgi:CubicO group peptidase (beta-lactamase class C family)